MDLKLVQSANLWIIKIVLEMILSVFFVDMRTWQIGLPQRIIKEDIAIQRSGYTCLVTE